MGKAESRQLWVKAYVFLLITAGIVFLLLIRPTVSADNWHALLLLIAFTFFAEAYPIELPKTRATVSVAFVPVFAAILIYGPGAGAWVGAVGSIRTRELKGQVSLDKVLFNRMQLGISAGIAGLVYVSLGGTPGTIDILAQGLAMVVSGITLSVVNIGTVALVIALSEGVKFWTVWFASFRWATPQFMALIPLGIIFASVQLSVGTAGTILFAVPLLISRYSFQLYMDMRDVHFSTMRALVSAIEARDPYTSGHSTRVTKYAVNTAREMGMGEEFCERLTLVCLLHDIGKIGIPDAVLLKRGYLSDEEFEVVERHPGIGANIVRQIKTMTHDVDAILHHHERYDGSGYPDSLSGDEIPMASRIVAVADAFDAITSMRPYREAATYTDAAAELKKCAGTQFDPEVVDVFLRANKAVDQEDRDSMLQATLREIAVTAAMEPDGGQSGEETITIEKKGSE